MMEIHRSVVEGINNGRTDANLGLSASRVAVNTSGTTVFACCHNQVYNIPVPSSIFTKNDCDTSTTTSTTTISAKPIIHPNSMAIPNSLHTHESPEDEGGELSKLCFTSFCYGSSTLLKQPPGPPEPPPLLMEASLPVQFQISYAP